MIQCVLTALTGTVQEKIFNANSHQIFFRVV